jgi:hypothetical protein
MRKIRKGAGRKAQGSRLRAQGNKVKVLRIRKLECGMRKIGKGVWWKV